MTEGGTTDPDARGEPACCKVGRSASRYGLGHLDEDLERRREEGESLRDLETFVNRRVLERALEDAGADTISDAAAIYGMLADDELGAGRHVELRQKLRRAGVDVPAVRSDFVSHQTVRDHLRNCLSIDTSVRAEVDRESARGTIEWARSRFLGITGRTLERLRTADELDVGELEVTDSVRVTCVDCGETYRLDDLVDRGRCSCPTTER